MKKTTAEQDPRGTARLRELIADISVAMMTTVSPDGALRSRPMFTQDMHGAGELWLFVSDDGETVHDLHDEHAVNLNYADPIRERYVSVTGMAELVRDLEKVHELWEPAMARYFPNGPDDPHLALLCVRIESAEYWDSPTRRMVGLPATHETPAEGEHKHIDIRSVRASG